MDIINHPMMNQLAPFASNLITLHYLYWLDNTECKCALTPLKRSLQLSFIILCIGSVIQIYAQSMKYNKFVTFFGIIYTLYSLYTAIYVIKYVHQLQKDKCNCSENWKRSYMYFTNIFELLLFVGSILYVFYTSIK